MKISNSKKELARIISENGGWQEHCEWAVQDKSGEFGESSVILFDGKDKPIIEAGMSEWMCAQGYESDSTFGKHVCDADKLVKNWHQTILSREEYFHLHPVDESEPEQAAEATPTIEQLAADYRNRKAYSDRKQQEADASKAEAESKLAELVAAGKALNLVISVAEQEPDLAITDYHQLYIGDILRCKSVPRRAKCRVGDEGVLKRMENTPLAGGVYVQVCDTDWFGVFGEHWEFIRRP